MGYVAWRRKRFWKSTRTRLQRHQRANTCLFQAQQSLKAAQDYHPVCLGGLEDRFAGIDQAEISVAYWWRERERIERQLKATPAQIKRLRRFAKERAEKQQQQGVHT